MFAPYVEEQWYALDHDEWVTGVCEAVRRATWQAHHNASKEEREDVASTVVYRLLKMIAGRWASSRPSAALASTWLRRVIHSCVVDSYRREISHEVYIPITDDVLAEGRYVSHAKIPRPGGPELFADDLFAQAYEALNEADRLPLFASRMGEDELSSGALPGFDAGTTEGGRKSKLRRMRARLNKALPDLRVAETPGTVG